LNTPASPARIAVYIPYRNREEHLKKMLPHSVSYFRRATNLEPVFILAEQVDDHPFNKGAILNAAYYATKDLSDYICFNDVDYLPMWADYSRPALPSRIVWWGLHERPIGHGTNGVIRAQKHGLAGVNLMTHQQFQAANGWSNNYWGWGYEDTDLARRLEASGFPIGYRDGTFIALDHDSNGYTPKGPSESCQRNEEVFNQQKYPNLTDGLSSISASVVSITNHMAKGLADETAPLIWCKFDLGESYAFYLESARSADVRSGQQPETRQTNGDPPESSQGNDEGNSVDEKAA